jgi:hypothetical protein
MKLMMIAMTLRHRAGLETVGGWMSRMHSIISAAQQAIDFLPYQG